MVLADGLVISDVISDRKGITQWHDGQFEQSGRVVYSALNDLELKNNLWSEVRHETGLNGLARTPNTFEDAQTLDEKIPRSGTRYIAGVFLMLIYSDVWTVSRVVILWTQKNYFFATRVLACRWLTNKWINESLFLVIRVFNFLSLKNKKKRILTLVNQSRGSFKTANEILPIFLHWEKLKKKIEISSKE